MATVDFMKNKAGNYGVPKQILDEEVTVSRYFDCTVDAMVSGDTYEAFRLPADVLLTGVWVVTDVAEGAAESIDVKDGSTVFLNDTSLNTTATATAGTNLPKAYATQDTVDVLANAAMTAAKFWVILSYIPLSRSY